MDPEPSMSPKLGTGIITAEEPSNESYSFCPLLECPAELQKMIAENLDSQSLLSFRTTCHHINDVSESSWKALFGNITTDFSKKSLVNMHKCFSKSTVSKYVKSMKVVPVGEIVELGDGFDWQFVEIATIPDGKVFYKQLKRANEGIDLIRKILVGSLRYCRSFWVYPSIHNFNDKPLLTSTDCIYLLFKIAFESGLRFKEFHAPGKYMDEYDRRRGIPWADDQTINLDLPYPNNSKLPLAEFNNPAFQGSWDEIETMSFEIMTSRHPPVDLKIVLAHATNLKTLTLAHCATLYQSQGIVSALTMPRRTILTTLNLGYLGSTVNLMKQLLGGCPALTRLELFCLHLEDAGDWKSIIAEIPDMLPQLKRIYLSFLLTGTKLVCYHGLFEELPIPGSEQIDFDRSILYASTFAHKPPVLEETKTCTVGYEGDDMDMAVHLISMALTPVPFF